MRLLIQRVKRASVIVEEKIVGSIDQGALVFLGCKTGDQSLDVDYLVNKLIYLRIFTDTEGKMNLSLLDLNPSVLIVSQFTLYGDCSTGRRPSFSQALDPKEAKVLYEEFIHKVQKHLQVQTGVFGAKMEVSLINDGPVTFVVDSKSINN